MVETGYNRDMGTGQKTRAGLLIWKSGRVMDLGVLERTDMKGGN